MEKRDHILRVIYHSGIPTAQSDYNGTLGFGGSISAQVAIHEIAHYLGSGTYGSWGGNFDGGGVWIGPSLRRYIKLFDGPGAEIRQSGVHYYPYGFNYGNEDSPIARYRIGRIATYVSGGYWKFTNLASGKALEVTGFSTDAGANIIAWNDTGGTNQQWRVFSPASGAVYWKLGNRNSTNMVVDVDGGPNATGDNTNISQYFDDLNAFNQDWAFDDVTPGVLTDGLVANYKLEGNPRDFGGRNFHGTASGGVTYTAGRIDGLAATFNGSDGSIRVPATVDRNFTLACWVKTTAIAGTSQWYNGMGIIDAEVPGAAKDFGLALVGNKAAFGVGQNDFTITSSNAINDGVWHHLAASFDAGTGAMMLYVDGILRASGTGPSSARTAPASFTLGSIAGTAGFLNGSIDEARLYNKILSQDELNRLTQTGSSLVASYSFDGNDRDATRFDNHGDSRNVTYTAGKIGGQAVQLSGASPLPAPWTATDIGRPARRMGASR